ncbi:SusC/RagA family TonB-linked outer membrane protein [Winogradskyella schleiferi]|uniref:SusC/RagA family TonB-linked outer membrane protein n=1 Tax=Winogradskyella schleiferi TaxID=2686078 RepID=UPI0015BC4F06|nr:SusC/RagA family TonB-linked outer membrane protein [Winogradskyella schleiferi]
MKTKFNGILTLFLALVVQFTFAQEKSISGTVTDTSGLPVPGVNVIIKGTTTGTQTDFDGKYTIDANQGDVLVFSYVGLSTKEVTVGASNSYDVGMAEDTEALDEVVVTAFGKAKQKRSLGYSATSIDSEELTEVTAINPLENLSGKVAGVNITAPNQPGASTKVIIRGYSSLSGNGPLYVIDGTPISSSANGTSGTGFSRSYDGGTNINDLDPNSIESINVLKGGPAAALYGSRAGGGAIIITTKKGRDKLKVEVKTAMDFLEVSRVPHLQTDFGQGWDGKGYSFSGGVLGASNENGSWGPAFNDQVRVWGNVVNNTQQIKPYSLLENNIKDFYDIGNTFSNSIRLSGGTEKSDFSLVFSRVDSDGVIPTDADALTKNTLNLNAGISADKFRVRVAANYAQNRQNAVNTGQGDGAGQGNTLMQELLQIPTDISVVDLEDYNNNIFNSNDYYFTPYANNPYFTVKENATNLSRERFYGNINFQYDLLPNLVATFQTGADILNGGVHSHGAIISYSADSPNAGNQGVVGGVTERTTQERRYESLFTLDYDTQLSDAFGFEASVGATMRNRIGSSLQVTVTNLDIPNYYEISNSAVQPVTTQSDYQEKNNSIFAALTFSYLDRIYLNLTGRNEWTSSLAPGNNSFFYPSANISAIAIDNGEHFVKLRAGYSQLANGAPLYSTESISNQGVAAAYFGSINFPFNGINSFEIGRTLGNLNIEPEFVNEYEFGIEANFFNRRVSLDAVYYNKKTDGAIISQQLPPSTGYGVTVGNFMDIENKGVELALGLVPIRTDDFRWDINYTFTKNENEVTDLPDGTDNLVINSNYGVTFNAVKGQPLGEFRALVPLTNDDGQIVVGDDGVPLTSATEQTIGNSQQDFVMGLQNVISYKNFRLSVGFDWKEGGEMYSYTSRLLGFTGASQETTFNNRLPFIVPNSVVDNGDGTYSENTTPIGFEDQTGYYNAQNNPSTEATNHLIDRTFIRLRDASLSYDFPSKWLDGTGISTFSLSVYGRNLMLWTPDDNPYVDPEVTSFGGADLASDVGEFAANPAQRTYGMSVNMSF